MMKNRYGPTRDPFSSDGKSWGKGGKWVFSDLGGGVLLEICVVKGGGRGGNKNGERGKCCKC